MAPAEKEELVKRLKFVQKKADQQKSRDPKEIAKRVRNGEIQPCQANAIIKGIETTELGASKKKLDKTNEHALLTEEDLKKKAKAVERASIKAKFSGMNQLENQHFEELFKQTMK